MSSWRKISSSTLEGGKKKILFPDSSSSQCTLAGWWVPSGEQLIDIDCSMSTGHQWSIGSPAAWVLLREHKGRSVWKGYLRAWILMELIYTSISCRETCGLLLAGRSPDPCVCSTAWSGGKAAQRLCSSVTSWAARSGAVTELHWRDGWVNIMAHKVDCGET